MVEQLILQLTTLHFQNVAVLLLLQRQGGGHVQRSGPHCNTVNCMGTPFVGCVLRFIAVLDSAANGGTTDVGRTNGWPVQGADNYTARTSTVAHLATTEMDPQLMLLLHCFQHQLSLLLCR